MTTQQSVWKATLNSGIILGLLFTIYNLLFYYLDLYFKPFRALIWIPVLLIILFLFMKQFRDNHRNGMVTYGQALGAGAVISIYYAIIAGLVVFVLYNFIDDGMVAKTLAVQEAGMVERGMPDASIDAAMKMYDKIMTATLIPVFQVVNSILGGTIASLILALFIKKEGNPLLDE
jgi:hypothetical protein